VALPERPERKQTQYLDGVLVSKKEKTRAWQTG
jgi:hypothetical protein